jgi:LDH2 family malate/lactate/ureidoglycolate dehydrogenase
MGQVIGVKSMQLAIDKAKEYGLGMVAVKNSTHYGIAGYYCTMATKNGCIGITGSNARPSVAPTFGIEGMLGTNPLTFGIPSDEQFDFVLDCATSIVQRGKIETLARLGLPTPPGTVITEDGSPMTDSEEILSAFLDGRAALAPLGGAGEALAGYKGFGFATVVEILCAALQNGKFMKELRGIGPDGGKCEYRLGHFFIAINVESFIQPEIFKRITGDILRSLRNSKKAPGADRIYTAGEKEYLAWLDRKDTGVPVNDSVQSELIAVRDELGLVQYRFPFE